MVASRLAIRRARLSSTAAASRSRRSTVHADRDIDPGGEKECKAVKGQHLARRELVPGDETLVARRAAATWYAPFIEDGS